MSKMNRKQNRRRKRGYRITEMSRTTDRRYDRQMLQDFWRQLKMEVVSHRDGYWYFPEEEGTPLHPTVGMPLVGMLVKYGTALRRHNVLGNDREYTHEQMCSASERFLAWEREKYAAYIEALRVLEPLLNGAFNALERQGDNGINVGGTEIPMSCFMSDEDVPEAVNKLY